MRESFASLYATLENMREVEGSHLHSRYVALFREENLMLFSLAVHATELRTIIRLAKAESGTLDRRAIDRIKRNAEASTSQYRRKMEIRSMEYMEIEDFKDDDSEHTDRKLLELFRRTVLAISYSNNGKAVEKNLFGKAEDAFRQRRADRMESLMRMVAETENTDTDDASLRGILEKEIVTVSAEIEELNLTYPYIMRTRLVDDKWIALEKARLSKEISQLRENIRQLESQCHDLGFLGSGKL